MVEVAAHSIADSAVVGDDDAIRRTLQKMVSRPQFASAAYIDVKGGTVRVGNPYRPDLTPPDWLRNRVADGLYDINQPINVGGRDYGVLRLSFQPAVVASGFWRLIVLASGLALASLAGGLVMIRIPLARWLRPLQEVRDFERDLRSGGPGAAQRLADDVPIEFHRTFDVQIGRAHG